VVLAGVSAWQSCPSIGQSGLPAWPDEKCLQPGRPTKTSKPA